MNTLLLTERSIRGHLRPADDVLSTLRAICDANGIVFDPEMRLAELCRAVAIQRGKHDQR